MDETLDSAVPIAAMRPLQGRWTLRVIAALLNGAAGFNEIRRATPGIGPSPLARCLSQLTQAGIVERELVDSQPPSSRYRMSHYGAGLAPVFDEMAAWAQANGLTVTDDQAQLSIALELFQRRWVLEIHCELLEGPQRFTDLSRRIGVNPVSLSQRLTELEQLGLVRKVTDSAHPAYAHTPEGQRIHGVGEALTHWALTRQQADAAAPCTE
ncbi:winged helix-turn-helix transcriptional regulator [Winogradskya humida]|uniref:winged helix-turn-helix transcriptional regulator n=1 Tax=Winogradskya humida TaxID=113566 RepID=UPI001943E51C|nr:helix-turn-helix domain-containing protein [Actinoplanes humidus]